MYLLTVPMCCEHITELELVGTYLGYDKQTLLCYLGNPKEFSFIPCTKSCKVDVYSLQGEYK